MEDNQGTESNEIKEEVEGETEEAVIPGSLPTPPQSNPTSPEDLSLEAHTIATTPVASGRTLVDIHNDFQVRVILLFKLFYF